MTLSPPAALIGCQEPRVASLPPFRSSAGEDAVDLAASVGLFLDPWQRFVLHHALGERDDTKWSAREVALIVPRQNGKGSILEARELYGLFLGGERLILHSAHEFKTAQEAFLRVRALIDGSDYLSKQVARVRTSHGEEGFELRNGARLRFVARSTGSGRGFSGDAIILDEAYNLSAKAMAALMPTMSARPNPQLWYTSSAGMEESEVLARIRERGSSGGGGRLAYFEWSADPKADLEDWDAWAEANPGLGVRIDVEAVEAEREAMDDESFARERLGIWADALHGQIIDSAAWSALTDRASQPKAPLAFAVDVVPSRQWASIAVAGRRADDRTHVEVVQNDKGTSWVAPRLAELVGKHRPCAVVLNPAGPAGSLIPELESLRVEVQKVGGTDLAQACGGFYDDAMNDRLRHLGYAKLNLAVDAARKRTTSNGAWIWDMRESGVDISQLVSVTLARHGLAVYGQKRPSGVMFL